MSKIDIIRAWKDEEYRLGLSDSERAQLPDNPAGLVELSDSDLNGAAGGTYMPYGSWLDCSFMDCPSWDFCGSWDACSQITVCPSYNYCPEDVVTF